MLCVVGSLTVPMYAMLSTTKYPTMLLLLTATRSARASFEDLLTLHRRTVQQSLIEDQLRPPLDMVTVDQE